jgi:LytS/YehU family sensor histidine kinase
MDFCLFVILSFKNIMLKTMLFEQIVRSAVTDNKIWILYRLFGYFTLLRGSLFADCEFKGFFKSNQAQPGIVLGVS